MTEDLLRALRGELAKWSTKYECKAAVESKLLRESAVAVVAPLVGVERVYESMYADISALSTPTWFVQLLVTRTGGLTVRAIKNHGSDRASVSPGPPSRRPAAGCTPLGLFLCTTVLLAAAMGLVSRAPSAWVAAAVGTLQTACGTAVSAVDDWLGAVNFSGCNMSA